MHAAAHHVPAKHRRAARLGLGALAATAALAALPSMASATTSCTFDVVTKRVDVTMDGGPGRTLHIFRVSSGNERIAVGADGEAGQLCNDSSIFGSIPATVSNTDKITVRSPFNPAGTDAVSIEETNGRIAGAILGKPTITLLTGTGSDLLQIVGTNGDDSYRVAGGPLQGFVQSQGDFGPPEIAMTAMGRLFINGQGGNDFISATRNVGIRAELFGGAGRDILTGGSSGKDLLDGGLDPDRVEVLNQKGGDRAFGGDGPDDVIVRDLGDTTTGFEIAGSNNGGVGKLKLAARTVTASAAKPGLVSMSWTHPKAWQHLSTVTVKAYDGAEQVGTVTLRPRSESVTGSGSLKLDTSETSIAKKGKTVTARLAIRTKPSLAGRRCGSTSKRSTTTARSRSRRMRASCARRGQRGTAAPELGARARERFGRRLRRR